MIASINPIIVCPMVCHIVCPIVCPIMIYAKNDSYYQEDYSG
jgi:hypothetical protein